MALVKKVATGFEGFISNKANNFIITSTNDVNKILQSVGLGQIGSSASIRNSTTKAATINKSGFGTGFLCSSGIEYILTGNNVELVLHSLKDIGNHTLLIHVVTDLGVCRIRYDDSSIRTENSSASWTTSGVVSNENLPNAAEVYPVKFKAAFDSGSGILRVIASSLGNSVVKYAELTGVGSFDSIYISDQSGLQDDLTIWEDDNEATAYAAMATAQSAGTYAWLKVRRYLPPLADELTYSTNGDADTWTPSATTNQADLTDGSDSTYSTATDDQGGFITGGSQGRADLDATIAAAGYVPETVTSVAVTGYRLQDDEAGSFNADLNADGLGSTPVTKAVTGQAGTAGNVYARWDETELATAGVSKSTKACTTLSVQ